MTKFLGFIVAIVWVALPSVAQPWLHFHSPSWIAVPQSSAHDYGVYYFRKDISLKSQPSSFPIDVSGDNRYKLYVNGHVVSIGPARSDVQNWNYEHMDIASYLKEGKNRIVAVVWNDGTLKPEANMSYRTGFFMKGTHGVSAVVNTDSTWFCTQDRAYRPLRQQVYGYYAAGPGEFLDFRQQVNDWNLPTCDFARWKKAQMINDFYPREVSGSWGTYSGWKMQKSPLPQMELSLQRIPVVRKAHGVKVPKNFLLGKSALVVPAHSDAELVLDQTYLTNAYFSLCMSQGKNARISIGYAESFYGDGENKGNRNDIEGKRFVGRNDSLISNGSEKQMFTTLAWRTYRYVVLRIHTDEAPLFINDVYGVFTGFPFWLKAQLQTSDKSLMKIFETGWRTARLCAMETYMDCPYYEQLQYFGDARIQALVSLYNTGDDRLVKNYLNQVEMSCTPEGIAQSRYPSTLAQFIHPYSLHYIYALHDYMMYGSDLKFLKGKLRSMRGILDYFGKYQGTDGRVVGLPGWNFSDWVSHDEHWKDGVALPGKDGCNAVMDLQLLYAYEIASEIEDKIGMQDFAKFYSLKAQELKKAIISNYWHEDKGLFSDVASQEVYSQHSNAFAILAKIFPDSVNKKIALKIESNQQMAQASVYFRYYLHQAMAQAGIGNHYIDWLDKWKENLSKGLTTWAETSEVETSRSDCHAWGASPNIELFRTVLGIDSEAPAFKYVKICPHLGIYKKIAGRMPHPNGMIEVQYDLTKKRNQVVIDLPTGITGVFLWKDKKYELQDGHNDITLY